MINDFISVYWSFLFCFTVRSDRSGDTAVSSPNHKQIPLTVIFRVVSSLRADGNTWPREGEKHIVTNSAPALLKNHDNHQWCSCLLETLNPGETEIYFDHREVQFVVQIFFQALTTKLTGVSARDSDNASASSNCVCFWPLRASGNLKPDLDLSGCVIVHA